MLRAIFVNIVLVALAISTFVAISAADSFRRRASCKDGDRKCFGRDKESPFYYRCKDGQWTLYTCGNGRTCSGSGPGTQCMSRNSPPPPPKCQDGQRRCVGSGNKDLYYHCSDACIPTAPPQCSSGTQRCVGNSGSYYNCVNGQWQYNKAHGILNSLLQTAKSNDPITSQWYGQATHQTHPELIKENDTTHGITAAEYETRRHNLVRDLPKGSIVVVFGAPIMFVAPHVFHQFRQDSDFYYLTGWNEPDSVAVIEKSEHASRGYTMTMFVNNKDPEKELWEGPRNGIEAAVSLFGADEARPINEFKLHVDRLAKRLGNQGQKDGSPIYTDFDTDYNIQRSPHCKVLKKALRQKNLGTRVHRLTTLIQQLRLIKSPAEIQLMRKANQISSLAFTKTMQACRPGMSEAALQAEFEHACKTVSVTGASNPNQATLVRPAYVPVFASGEHALCMHYVQNSGIMKDGDLILVDAGTEYASYASDITRTFPVNGRFSDAQRDLYSAVLSVKQQMIQLCHSDSEYSLNEIQRCSTRALAQELKQIGFHASDSDISNRLYPHHISHYLGIDVHDTMDLTRSQRLKPNMVVTIEPGIYVPYDSKFPKAFQGIGIRIEDDIVVGRTKEEIENLGALCPETVEDIEACMLAKAV
ncbi:aminopeptidase [Coemansia sp. RSA 1933]|nr:aminopeptidase [Coemansia sp. RSA 1933]